MKYTPEPLDFWEKSPTILRQLRRKHGGIICCVVDDEGNTNAITLGWGLIGPHYGSNPIVAIAVCPPRFSFRFLEETGEFVLAIPGDDQRPAADLCGTESGRDTDKFEAAGLTRLPSQHVSAPSVAECPINVECRTYTKVSPPHFLLTEKHRAAPLDRQHTIYFAEVLGTYRYLAD